MDRASRDKNIVLVEGQPSISSPESNPTCP